MRRWALDHLVVAAESLDAGVRWCERELGITPGPGGRHPMMGTHNRLFAVASPAFPRAYLEIIAIDPDGEVPARPRWFDLDDPALRAALASGPRLIHWVARSDDLEDDRAALVAGGHDPGEPIAAERETPDGPLRWRITVRPDGRRLCGGALPTLIAWGDRHPADRLADAGVVLERLQLGPLPAAAAARLPAGVQAGPAEATLMAHLHTPRGRVAIAG